MLAGAGRAYPAASVWGSEAEGDAADVFDDALVAFATGVGQSGGDGGDDRLLPAFDGIDEAADLRDGAGGAEAVELVQRRGDLVP